MRSKRVLMAGAIVALLALTACSGTGSGSATTANPSSTSSVNAQATPGSVTPSGPLRVGSTWMITVHSAHAYPNGWQAPAGMHGNWGHMAGGYMAVVLDVSAQSGASPVPGTSSPPYAGPVCAMRGGWGMMGPMMGNGEYGWQMMAQGLYRGPMAFMAPTSTRQFTLICTDEASGNQASWNIGF